jgi:hypothetical protein
MKSKGVTMPESIDTQGLARAFQWRPGPIWDPVPDWIITYLDKSAVIKLAQIQLELGMNVLKAQVEATQKVQEVIGRSK